MTKDYLRIRNFLGILGTLLPFLCIIGCLFVGDKPTKWWYSISATYHITPVLTSVLSAIGIFLICYRSYDKIDTIVNTSAGICGLLVVMFPCNVEWIADGTLIGLFQVPIQYSSIIHLVAAAVLFILLAYNSYFLFSKGNNEKKNKVYKICGGTMFITLIFFASSYILGVPNYFVMIYETILLLAFGTSWLVKGGLFDKRG